MAAIMLIMLFFSISILKRLRINIIVRSDLLAAATPFIPHFFPNALKGCTFFYTLNGS